MRARRDTRDTRDTFPGSLGPCSLVVAVAQSEMRKPPRPPRKLSGHGDDAVDKTEVCQQRVGQPRRAAASMHYALRTIQADSGSGLPMATGSSLRPVIAPHALARSRRRAMPSTTAAAAPIPSEARRINSLATHVSKDWPSSNSGPISLLAIDSAKSARVERGG